jgi:hypothetical protein
MLNKISRRQMLQNAGNGFGGLFLASFLEQQLLQAKTIEGLHFPARAKRVIFLFMHGGPSHVDTFDYKPKLMADDGKPLPFDKPRVQFSQTGNLLASPWKFKQYGESGAWVSDLFPEVGACADDITFLKSMHGSNEAHGGALLKIHTGSDTFVRPSMGAWVSYGLGSENENLPSFITINPTLGHGGVQNFGSAFLPAQHQATRIGKSRESMKTAKISNLVNATLSQNEVRAQLDLAQQWNQQQLERVGADSNLEARIQSMELAFRMQTETPGVMDLSGETEATMKLYESIHPIPRTLAVSVCWQDD